MALFATVFIVGELFLRGAVFLLFWAVFYKFFGGIFVFLFSRRYWFYCIESVFWRDGFLSRYFVLYYII